MTNRSLLLAGALALASFSIASAKSYDIMLTEPALAGSVQLKAGEYHVKVEGNSAVFTNVETAQKFTAPVKVEKAGKKYEQTAVETNASSGTEKVQAIELGGSDERIEFGD